MEDRVNRCAEELGKRAKYQSQSMGLLIGLADRLGMPNDTFNPDPHREFSLDSLYQQIRLLVRTPGLLNVKRLEAGSSYSFEEPTPGRQTLHDKKRIEAVEFEGPVDKTSLASSHNEF